MIFEAGFLSVCPSHLHLFCISSRSVACTFPEIFVADRVWPAYLQNPPKTGVNEGLDLFVLVVVVLHVSAP